VESLPRNGRDRDDIPAKFMSDPLVRLLRSGNVHLGDDQELGPLGEGLAVLSELVANRPVILDRVRPIDWHRLDQMDQERCPFRPGMSATTKVCSPATTLPRLGYFVVNG
jgi:hypothetical protein